VGSFGDPAFFFDSPPGTPSSYESLSLAPGEASKERNWIHLSSVAPNLEVKVGARGVSGVTAQGDDLATLHFLPFPNPYGGKVSIHGQNSSRMIQPDNVSISAHDSSKPHPASGHGSNLGAVRHADIDAAVEIGFEA